MDQATQRNLRATDDATSSDGWRRDQRCAGAQSARSLRVFRDEAFDVAAERDTPVTGHAALDSLCLPGSAATAAEARRNNGVRRADGRIPRDGRQQDATFDALDKLYPPPLPRSRLAGFHVLPSGRHFDGASRHSPDLVLVEGQTASERVWVTCEPDATCRIAFASLKSTEDWSLRETREPITLGQLTKVIAQMRAQEPAQAAEATLAVFEKARDALVARTSTS